MAAGDRNDAYMWQGLERNARWRPLYAVAEDRNRQIWATGVKLARLAAAVPRWARIATSAT
jgi:hypothetical protein